MKTYRRPLLRDLGDMAVVTQKTGSDFDGASLTKKDPKKPKGF